MAKAGLWAITDTEERKCGERTGLDTRSTIARLKLKGIDGAPHKQRSMRLNSTQREEPYQGLTYSEKWQRCHVRKGAIQVVHGCRQLVS